MSTNESPADPAGQTPDDAAGGGGPGDAPATPVSPGDLALPADVACDLLSSHGGEIVITDDGRVVFMNAAAHLVELAAALDPENEEIQARLAVVRGLDTPPGDHGNAGAEAAPPGTPDA